MTIENHKKATGLLADINKLNVEIKQIEDLQKKNQYKFNYNDADDFRKLILDMFGYQFDDKELKFETLVKTNIRSHLDSLWYDAHKILNGRLNEIKEDKEKKVKELEREFHKL